MRFLATGQGRSGTMWLARLLDTDPTVGVYHEPLKEYDFAHLGDSFIGALDVARFLRERRPLMQRINAQQHLSLSYGEVNNRTRYIIEELGIEFGAPVVAIVRDGRYTVRSFWRRGFFQSELNPPIKPPKNLDRFAKCCWYWADAYRRLMGQGVPIVRLEDLNQDYAAICVLCDIIDVDVTFASWTRFAGVKINARKYPDELGWDLERTATFAALAGDVQERLGYSL